MRISRLRSNFTFALFLLLCGCGGRVPHLPVPVVTAKFPGPPSPPAHFLFRPTIETTEGKFSAGTAFTVTIPGEERPILITARHILGTTGKTRAGVPEELRKVIKRVTLVDCFDESYALDAGNDILPLDVAQDPRNLGVDFKAGDILAIRLPKGVALGTLKLAQGVPPAGERIWFAAQILEGAPRDQILHSAKAGPVPAEPWEFFTYSLDRPDVLLRATSGAPFLNGDGEVVAINEMQGAGESVIRFGYYIEAAAKTTR